MLVGYASSRYSSEPSAISKVITALAPLEESSPAEKTCRVEVTDEVVRAIQDVLKSARGIRRSTRRCDTKESLQRRP